jgi:hypothetical protein
MRQLIALLCAFALPAVAAAQGFIESASPPLLERGKTTRVAFSGHDLAPGLDLWHSLPAASITAKPVESHSDRLVFDVTASADAPVGICGLRIATCDGLTNAILFHIEDLPVRGNPGGANPTPLLLPACVWGTFREATVDRFAIAVAAGETISFEAIANRLGKDADPLITIRDPTGKFVTECDNDPGLYFDFRFAHTFPQAGTYTVEIRDARFKASEHHHYILRMGKFPAERIATPCAVSSPDFPGLQFEPRKRPGDDGSSWAPVSRTEGPIVVAGEFAAARDSALSQATSGPAQLAFWLAPTRANPFQAMDRLLTTGRLQAEPTAIPATLCGVLRTPGQPQAFAFPLAKGQRIFVRGDAKSLNSPVDLDFAVTDRFGRELRRPNDSRDGAEPMLDFTASAAGEHGLVVRNLLRQGGDSNAYRLVVRDRPFPPTLTAEVEGLTIPQGDYQPIPILVSRSGSTGPIKLSLLNPPRGVTLSPTEIPESAASIVCKLEAAVSAPLGVYSLRIVAECGRDKTLVGTRPLIDKKLVNVDLIPIALREDQTRLPPSLTDHFAIQITPPSPFSVELVSPAVTLCRYQSAPIPIVATRRAGFEGPISFQAVGGQLAPKSEGRTRVYAEFPQATAAEPNVTGVIVSKILSNLGKTRIDITAAGTHRGRTITLTRCFELDLTTAFRFAPEPARASLFAGETTSVTLTMRRIGGFAGPITLQLSPQQGLTFPETVVIPQGRDSVELAVAASPDAQPRRQLLNVHATGDVDGFEEEIRGQPIEIEVKKVEPPKKK